MTVVFYGLCLAALILAGSCLRAFPVVQRPPCMPTAQAQSVDSLKDGPLRSRPPSILFREPYNVAVDGRIVATGRALNDSSPLPHPDVQYLKALAILSEGEGRACWGSQLKGPTLSLVF